MSAPTSGTTPVAGTTPTSGTTPVAGTTPATGTDVPWTRLHPLSPLIRSSRAVVAVLVVLVPRPLVMGDRDSLRVDLVILGVALSGAAVSWLVTRWRIIGAELQIETGLLRRQSIRIPLRRVQAVDLVRPLAGRLFGLTEVRVVLAGSGTGHSGLSYLPSAEAHRVRDRLLAVGSGVEAPEPEAPLVRTATRRLVASVVLSLPALVLVLLVTGLAVVAVLSGDPTAAAGLLPVVLGTGGALGRRFNAQYGTSVTAGAEELHVRGGLLQTRMETVPYDRVQAVRWVEPLLWRPFGWCRLEVDVARQRAAHEETASSARLDRALLPVGPRADARRLLARLLPTADPAAPRRHPPPRRARWWKAPMSYQNLGVWADDTLLVSSGGRLRRTSVLVPLAKVQSLRLVQGPYARRLRLATLHVDLAGHGGWGAAARCRDQAEAAELLDVLAARAQAARLAGLQPD